MILSDYIIASISHRIHVWYIYLHLPYMDGMGIEPLNKMCGHFEGPFFLLNLFIGKVCKLGFV